MAALEKIRSKSVMLLIVIGVALLAFIIGDFLNSGRSFFGTGTTVAVVDGTKISITDFQRRYEEANQRMQQTQQKMDGAVMQSYVLQEMVDEHLLSEELEALAINVSDAELTEAMTGAHANPQMVQFANQMGMETPAQLHDLIFNPGKYGVSAEQVQPVRAQWLQLEKDMERTLRYQKLSFLLSGALQANDLDKAAVASEMSNAAKVNIAYVPYTTLEDKDYEIAEADVKACYDKEKSFLKVDQETRRIRYIAVDIIPSAADKEVALKQVARADSLLHTEGGVDAVRNTLPEFAVEQRWVLASNVDDQMKSFLKDAEIGAVSAAKMTGDVHSMTKLLAKKNDIDSINVNMLQVNGNKAVQDSILNLLNSGKAFAEVADNKVAGGQENVWMNMMGMGADAKSVEAKAKILGAGKDYFVIDGNDNAALIYRVNEKVAPKQMFEIAEVSLTVYPSDETINNLHDGLQNYISTNNTGKAFVENAVAAGYQPILAEITEETPQVNRIENTRKLVQWAFGATKGDVSSIFDKEDNGKMIAATLDEVIEEGYMPMNDASIRPVLESKARNSKKGDALMAKFEGKANDLKGYATLMNVPVDTAVVVSFSQDFVPTVRGIEPMLTAKAPYSKQGELVGPVKGDQGVFVYEVAANDKSASTLTPQQAAERYSMMFGANSVSQHLMDILRNNKSVENNLIDFY